MIASVINWTIINTRFHTKSVWSYLDNHQSTTGCPKSSFTGLSVEGTAKNLEKSECWVVKWSSKKEGLNTRNDGEDRKSWIKQLK